MDISGLLNLLKLPLRILIFLLVLDILLLWEPSWMVSKLGLREFLDEYRKYLGPIFLLLSVGILAWLTKNIIQYVYEKKIAKKRLWNLTPREKEILAFYIINNTRSQELPMSDGTVSELERIGIIYRSSDLGHGGYFDYNIQPWVWDYLHKHPKILE